MGFRIRPRFGRRIPETIYGVSVLGVVMLIAGICAIFWPDHMSQARLFKLFPESFRHTAARFAGVAVAAIGLLFLADPFLIEHLFGMDESRGVTQTTSSVSLNEEVGEFLTYMVNHDYQSALEMVDPEADPMPTAEVLERMWSGLEARLGSFQKVLSFNTNFENPTTEPLISYTIHSRMERGQVNIIIRINTRGKITGLLFEPVP